MNSKNFFDWCRTAVSGIKYRPDRDAVHKELYAHMEDRYDSFIARGAEPAEAERRTVEAMGSAEELIPQLAAIHRPFWPYILLVSRCLLILIAALTTIPLIKSIGGSDITKPNFENFYPQCEYNAYLDTAYQAVGAEGSRLFYLEPGYNISVDDYKVAVKKAALWQHQYGDKREHQLHIQLEVKNLRPWMEPLQITKLLCAEDSIGNQYLNVNEAVYGDAPVLGGIARRTGLFTYTYELYIDNYVSQGASWVDLRYDREGRNLRLRLYLAGGGEQ